MKHPRFVFLLILVTPLVFTACEASFDPFEENEAAFSLFGYVDTASDTQFVRVGSLRRTAYSEAPLEAVVTLENLESGETIVLRDSLFTFSNDAKAHNFWTDHPIQPETTYRLTATRRDGVSSFATFHTPEPILLPSLESGLSEYSSPRNPPMAQSMTFYGIEKLADLRITYELEEPELTLTVSYLKRVVRTPRGDHVLGFSAYADVQKMLSGSAGRGCPGLRKATVFVAAATEEWPDFFALDDEFLALPHVASNVTNGLGYVGGVITLSGVWPAMNAVFSLNRAGCLD